MSAARSETTLAATLSAARARHGLSLRAVERRTGIRSGHLSQLESGRIAKPEMAMLWDLATVYGLDFEHLLELAGHAGGGTETSERQRHRMTVALRAMRELSPAEQTEALRFMAELKARRSGD